MANILVAGLNAAWQQIFTVPILRRGEVNRAAGFEALASGKGLNAAKVLARLGHEVSLLQILAGENGRRVRDACADRGIRSLHAFTEGETRVCATLLHAGEITEIIAPFSAADERVPRQLLAHLRPGDGYDALLICGTMPAGLPEDFYGAIADRVRAPLAIWDSVAGLAPDRLARVSWLKVNAAEHRALAPALDASPARPALLITAGAAPALVRLPAGAAPAEPRAWTCAVPPLDRAVNPVGAGDTATALLADGLLRGLDPRAAVARALAAASASCLNPLPAEWDPADAARLEAAIRWTAA